MLVKQHENKEVNHGIGREVQTQKTFAIYERQRESWIRNWNVGKKWEIEEIIKEEQES